MPQGEPGQAGGEGAWLPGPRGDPGPPVRSPGRGSVVGGQQEVGEHRAWAVCSDSSPGPPWISWPFRTSWNTCEGDSAIPVWSHDLHVTQ